MRMKQYKEKGTKLYPFIDFYTYFILLLIPFHFIFFSVIVNSYHKTVNRGEFMDINKQREASLNIKVHVVEFLLEVHGRSFFLNISLFFVWEEILFSFLDFFFLHKRNFVANFTSSFVPFILHFFLLFFFSLSTLFQSLYLNISLFLSLTLICIYSDKGLSYVLDWLGLLWFDQDCPSREVSHRYSFLYQA